MDIANFVLTFGPAGLVIWSLGTRLIRGHRAEALARRESVERAAPPRRRPALPIHVMLRSGTLAQRNAPAPVYIPVAHTAYQSPGMAHAAPDLPDIDAENAPDRDITRETWIVKMAVAKGPDRTYHFSANQIFAAIGGDRNTVLATIRAIRSGVPAAAFRQDDGTTAPASYPVTKKVSSA